MSFGKSGLSTSPGYIRISFNTNSATIRSWSISQEFSYLRTLNTGTAKANHLKTLAYRMATVIDFGALPNAAKAYKRQIKKGLQTNSREAKTRCVIFWSRFRYALGRTAAFGRHIRFSAGLAPGTGLRACAKRESGPVSFLGAPQGCAGSLAKHMAIVRRELAHVRESPSRCDLCYECRPAIAT